MVVECLSETNCELSNHTMKIITWSEEYSVGVKELDRQHQQIIHMINELAKCQEQEPAEQCSSIPSVVNEIHDYIIDHFGLEERLLTQAKFRDLAAHKQGHNRFINRFSHLCAQLGDNNAESVAQLLAYLNDWWDSHILHEDMKYSRLLGRH
jgi:hemerythrin-like metal-binding protein